VEEFSGIRAGKIGSESGFWIRNACTECFVTSEQRIRILHFGNTGGENLFLNNDSLADGLRCWIMTPYDKEEERDDLASRKGIIEQEGSYRLNVRTTELSDLGIYLNWRITLDPELPLLMVDHILKHEGDSHREIAIWPVIGVRPGSRILLPFKQQGDRTKDTRILHHFPWSTLQDPRLATSMNHIQLDIREGLEEAHLKFGVHQASGSGAALTGDSVLVSQTPHDPDGIYPEGGPNITAYGSPANQVQPYGELENVGGLSTLSPGHSISLRQVLSIEDAADSEFLRSIGYPNS